MNTRVLGKWGEAAAANHLRANGYTLLAAGYYTRFGEIDLIASGGGYLAFVEVKLRRDGRFAEPREFVQDCWREVREGTERDTPDAEECLGVIGSAVIGVRRNAERASEVGEAV